MSADRVMRVQVIGPAGRERVARSYQWAATQPSWIARAAAMAFLIVVGLPILLLVGLAVLIAVVVFGTLALVNSGLRALRNRPHGDDGRKNVIVRRK